MSETTPLIKAALNLRVGAGFDVYITHYVTDRKKASREIPRSLDSDKRQTSKMPCIFEVASFVKCPHIQLKTALFVQAQGAVFHRLFGAYLIAYA